MPSIANRRFDDALYWCACALLGGVIVFELVNPLLTLGRFIPLDPNEGWNAYFGDIAIHSGQLYPPQDSLITNNYPPLSFYIVGAVGYLMGDNIFAGRVIALLSLLFVSWSVYCWLRMTGSARRIGVLGAASFLAYALTYGSIYVAMDDPQWLADAVMMSGLLVLWRRTDDTRHLILASALITAAVWTKQLLLPLPLAASLWLLGRSRSAFAKWVLCLAAGLALACALAWWFHGSRLFESLHEPRQYSRHQAIGRTAAALKVFAPLVALSLISLMKNRRSERGRFVSAYLFISAGMAFFVSGGAGVDVNAFFDFMIAASLAAALGLEALWSGQGPREAPRTEQGAAAALALAACIVAYAVSLAPAQIEKIRNIDASEAAALEDINLIVAESHGRAACELPGLCYWAKSPFLIDFFYFGQKLKTGRLPSSACATAFGGSYISLVQLHSNLKFRARLLPEYCNDMISARYRPIRESSFGPLMVPTGGSPSHNR